MLLPEIQQIANSGVNKATFALVDEGGVSLTYSQLAEALSRLPQNQSGMVIIYCDNSIESVLSYLFFSEIFDAVALLPAVTTSEVRQKFRELYSPDFEVEPVKLRKLRRAAELPNWIEASLEPARSSSAVQNSLSNNTLTKVLLLSTSGSTGSPKMVRLARTAVVANARDIAAGLDLSSADIAPTLLPLSYSYGLSVVNSILISGGCVATGNFDLLSRSTRKFLVDSGATHIAGVPSSYELYERVGLLASPPDGVRQFTQAGGKLPLQKISQIANRLHLIGKDFRPMYGQTEATARMAITESGDALNNPEFVGRAIQSGEITLQQHDEKNNELVFRGPNVMLGYANDRSDLLLGDINQGKLFTGDIGELDENGRVRILGRIKRIAKISGFRINLDELEAQLAPLGEIYVTSNDNKLLIAVRQGVRVGTVQEFLGSRNLFARSYVILEFSNFPTLANGKLDMKAIGAQFE